jgi:hypothetical protein
MRLLPIAFTLLLLSGCVDREAAPQAPLAWMGPDTLVVQRLAEILVLAQPMELTPDQAGLWVQQWLEVSAVAEAAARGVDLWDEGLTERAISVELQEALILDHVARASGDLPPLTDERVDSIYRAGELRLIGHIFRSAGPGLSPSSREDQRAVAERLHRILAETGQLSVVNLENEDPVAREQGGVRLVSPGELPPDLEAVAYALEPGQLSALVESPFGFHVVFRPRLEGIQPTYARMVEERLREELHAWYLDEREELLEVEVEESGMTRIESVLTEPLEWVDREEPVARHPGGGLTAGEVARLVLHLPPGAAEDILRQGEEGMLELVRELAARARLEGEALESRLVPLDDLRADLVQGYRRQVEALWRHARIHPDSLAVEAPDPGQRLELALWRVDQYLEALAARRVPLESVPPLLAAHLLSEQDWGMDEARVGEAVALAGRLLAAAGYEGPGDLTGLTAWEES